MNEQQLKNTLNFLRRVDLKGQEAMALVEIQQILGLELQAILDVKPVEEKEKDKNGN